MAAIYSGIHLKLKSPQTPWEDRLKLARFAWISAQCLLPNKEQVLLDWCTHALTGRYSQKVDFSQDVLEGLWRYLDDLLHSRKLHSLLKQGKTVSLRLNMAQLLLERLQECARVGSKSPVCASTVLSVCRGLLSSPALSSVFTTKYELMVDLLAKLCSLACRDLQQPSVTEAPSAETTATCPDEEMTEIEPIAESPHEQPESDVDKCPSKAKENLRAANLFEVLLQSLSCYLSVQRQQANPNRVFTMVTNQLLQPLLLLRHLLTSGESSASHAHLRLRPQLCRDIRVKIDSILHSALFPSEHLSSYKEELLPSKEESGKRGPGGAKGPLKPVSAILSKLSAAGGGSDCEPALRYSVKSNATPLLFKFFLESYGKARGESEEALKMLCFYFLRRLVPALDIIPLEGQSGKAEQPVSESPPDSWSLALLAVESLLSQTLAADIYNVAADKIRHGEVQLNFYRTLAQMLLNQAQPSIPAWYRCLKVLLSLNHLILEPDLDRLSSLAWVDSECVEARVQRAKQLLVCSLLQTYTKLRQLPRLFSELLPVVCGPATDRPRPPLLSQNVSASLRACLLDAPPSQGLEVCSLVLESIRKYILADLASEDREEAEKMEIDGGGDEKEKVDRQKKDASLKLLSLSQLLHVVLFGLKTLDNASPVPLVRQSQSLMEDMQQIVNDLLRLLPTVKTHSAKKTQRKGEKTLSSEPSVWAQKTQEAALLLRYTWVEVDTLFYIHCSKYIPPNCRTVSVREADDLAPTLTRIESLLSGEISPARLQPSCSPTSCLLFKLLALQQMKKVLLDDVLLSDPNTAPLLSRVARFILAKSDFEAGPDGAQVWDGQIGSVTAGSYPAAHWHLVTSNLPLFAPYLSAEDVGCVADVILSSLLGGQTTDGGKEGLTVPLISSQLLQSPVLVESPALFSATVCSFTRRVVGVLKAGRVLKACPTILKFQEEEPGVNPGQPLFSKETIVEDTLALSKVGEVSVSLTDAQRKELTDLLQILKSLNTDGMTSEDLSSVFLVLLFTLACTSGESPRTDTLPQCGDDAAFVAELLRVLTCLLEGRHSPGVLKLVHGGPLLQAVVSALLQQSNGGRFGPAQDRSDLIKAAQGFITCLVQLIVTRNSSVRLNLDQFASYLTGAETAAVSGKPGPAGEPSVSVHLLLASLASFSQAMTSNLGRSKPMDQTLTQMLARTTASLGPVVQSVLKPQTSVLGQAFLVEVVTVMLRCEMSTQSVEEEGEKKAARLTLRHTSLYRGFGQQILREISSAERPVDFLLSSLHFLSTFYTAVEKTSGGRDGEPGGAELDELFMQILQTVNRLLAAAWLSPDALCELEPAVQELLRPLVERSGASRFNLLLLLITGGLDINSLRAGRYREVLSAVVMVKLLSCCHLPELCSKALWLIAPQIISAMVSLVRSSSQDVSLTLPFTVPAVTSLTSLLRQGEGRITNPHHVVLGLGALQAVPLDHLTPAGYQAAFLCVHEGLFAIVQCHPQVMLNAAPSFLNVFHRLLGSIMQEGRQRGDGDTGPDSAVYLQCSRLVERMYSHIAATAESFTTLSAFMVAQYVTELQKVTLRPDIKLHLTEGIYRILDLCVEQDIKFLTAGLQMGVREVFNELYSSYTHYHKAQRQGEDKYTV